MSIGNLHVLWFVPEGEGAGGDALLIGIYESRDLAEQAIQRLRSKPGFSAHPDRFQIHISELNRDYWTDGFTVEG